MTNPQDTTPFQIQPSEVEIWKRWYVMNTVHGRRMRNLAARKTIQKRLQTEAGYNRFAARRFIYGPTFKQATNAGFYMRKVQKPLNVGLQRSSVADS